MSVPQATRGAMLAVTLLLAAGCFTTTADYQAEAETFIVEEVTIPEEDVTFTEATCDEPTSQDPGSEFSCTGIDQSGATWRFRVTIEEDNRFVVEITDRP
jgi:hypothetical protein